MLLALFDVFRCIYFLDKKSHQFISTSGNTLVLDKTRAIPFTLEKTRWQRTFRLKHNGKVLTNHWMKPKLYKGKKIFSFTQDVKVVYSGKNTVNIKRGDFCLTNVKGKLRFRWCKNSALDLYACKTRFCFEYGHMKNGCDDFYNPMGGYHTGGFNTYGGRPGMGQYGSMGYYGSMPYGCDDSIGQMDYSGNSGYGSYNSGCGSYNSNYNNNSYYRGSNRYDIDSSYSNDYYSKKMYKNKPKYGKKYRSRSFNFFNKWGSKNRGFEEFSSSDSEFSNVQCPPAMQMINNCMGYNNNFYGSFC